MALVSSIRDQLLALPPYQLVWQSHSISEIPSSPSFKFNPFSYHPAAQKSFVAEQLQEDGDSQETEDEDEDEQFKSCSQLLEEILNPNRSPSSSPSSSKPLTVKSSSGFRRVSRVGDQFQATSLPPLLSTSQRFAYEQRTSHRAHDTSQELKIENTPHKPAFPYEYGVPFPYRPPSLNKRPARGERQAELKSETNDRKRARVSAPKASTKTTSSSPPRYETPPSISTPTPAVKREPSSTLESEQITSSSSSTSTPTKPTNRPLSKKALHRQRQVEKAQLKARQMEEAQRLLADIDESDFEQLPGYKRFKCPVHQCDISFQWFSLVVSHMKKHAGEKPFPCTHPGCDKFFNSKAGVQAHAAVHSDDRPFLCPFAGCEKSFKKKAHLSNHYSGCHGGPLPS